MWEVHYNMLLKNKYINPTTTSVGSNIIIPGLFVKMIGLTEVA